MYSLNSKKDLKLPKYKAPAYAGALYFGSLVFIEAKLVQIEPEC
jgi:hypothetical protein